MKMVEGQSLPKEVDSLNLEREMRKSWKDGENTLVIKWEEERNGS